MDIGPTAQAAPLIQPGTKDSDLKTYEFPGGFTLRFQSGAMELGRNGATTDEVLEMLLSHIGSFQKGAFACQENDAVLFHIAQAKFWQWLRSMRRQAAGTKGRSGSHDSKDMENDEPLLQFFSYNHLPEILKGASRPFCLAAHELVAAVPRNPERTVALRKLLEAKDCAVRALISVPVQNRSVNV
jgi:hypothetical protein